MVKQRSFSVNNSEDGYIHLWPFEPGEYSVHIIDVYNGQYNPSDPVFIDMFVVKAIAPTSITTSTTTTTSVTDTSQPPTTTGE